MIPFSPSTVYSLDVCTSPRRKLETMNPIDRAAWVPTRAIHACFGVHSKRGDVCWNRLAGGGGGERSLPLEVLVVRPEAPGMGPDALYNTWEEEEEEK